MPLWSASKTMAFQVDCADDNSWQKERLLALIQSGGGSMTGLSETV